VNRPLVIGNWKMNLDFVEAVHLTQQLSVLLKNQPSAHTDAVVAPPFVDLRSVASVLEAERSSIALAAQHVNPHESGAHTGEISQAMLARLGVTWVLVGHSERRANYAMDDAVVAATLATVVRSGANAVLCVGEDEAARDAGEYESVVSAQLTSALAGLEEKSRALVTVAYEPIWAIGTGRSAAPEQIAEMGTVLRRELAALGCGDARVLYGGSVTGENAAAILVQGGVDGFLVGGASLKAESFVAIIRACDDCYAGLANRR
jgi:triosephosphate isomerase